MGKNYYFYIKKEIQDWNVRKEQSLEEAQDMKGLIPIIEQYYEDRQPKKYHLGKYSAGWKFLFQWNDGKFYRDEPSLYEFLDKINIIDEYRSSYSREEFWDIVMKKHLDKSVRSTEWKKDYIYLLGGFECSNSIFC